MPEINFMNTENSARYYQSYHKDAINNAILLSFLLTSTIFQNFS